MGNIAYQIKALKNVDNVMHITFFVFTDFKTTAEINSDFYSIFPISAFGLTLNPR